MKPGKLYVYFSLILFTVLVFCGQETILYDEPEMLHEDEFTFVPETPRANKDVSLVYFGCQYYETFSVTFEQEDILIVKKFNGSMKRPCILARDTISLGNLSAGDYQVTLQIIDISSFASDSLFYSETKILKIR